MASHYELLTYDLSQYRCHACRMRGWTTCICYLCEGTGVINQDTLIINLIKTHSHALLAYT